MLEMALMIALIMVSISFVLSFYRLVMSDEAPSRILALDTLYINLIALLVLYGLYQDSNLFFESALLIAVMGFVGTIALSKYVLHGDIME